MTNDGSITTARGPSTDLAGALITALGGVLMTVSPFLPWMTAQAVFLSISRNAFQLGNQQGFSIDGPVLLVLGLATIVVGATRAMRTGLPTFLQRSPIVLGVVCAIVPLSDVGGINNLVQRVRDSSSLATASIGFGLWIAIVAGVISVVGGLVLRSSAPAGRLATSPATAPNTGGPGATAGLVSTASEARSGGSEQALRECPFCKEGMRRDASVCPHCRRDSTAWRHWQGRWWTTRPDGTQAWLDEAQQTWRGVTDPPAPTSALFDLVISAAGNNPAAVARIVAEESAVSTDIILASLREPPATVLTAVGYATAEGVRLAITKQGAEAKVVPSSSEPLVPPPTSQPA